MMTFKKFILREGVKISNKEKFDMWDSVQRGEISEDEFLKAIEFERFKPNSKLQVISHNGNDFHINESLNDKDIHTKSFYNENGKIDVWERWMERNIYGNLVKSWDNRGNERLNDEKIDEKGQLMKTKIRKENGKLYVKHIEVFEKKQPNRKPNKIYDYYEGENGVEQEIKYEYRYDEDGREIYKKENSILDNRVIETVREYWDDGVNKNIRRYENGKLTKEESFTKKGDRKLPESLSKIAEKRAEEYNRKYHGIFLHSASMYDIKNLIKIKEDGNKAEICVSTLRSNTVFQSGSDRVVIVGFGNIRELYDYDSYSERDEDGSRYATQMTDGGDNPDLHNIRKDHIEGYDDKYHYDEGFMDFSNAEVVAVFADYDYVINNWVSVDDGGNMYSDAIMYKKELPKIYKTYNSYVSDRVDKIKVTSFKEFIKKIDPNIKVIGLKDFNKLQNSEELMRLMYKLKGEKESSEIMDEPLHPYEEKTNFKTFKQYVMEDYKGEHTAPDEESGAPAYDLTINGIYPKDVYNMPSWYESEEGLDEMYKILRLKGRADGPVWIHRAIPMEVYKRLDNKIAINRGDWVTTSKQYAKDHGESLFKDDYKIISKRVRASEIFTNGDSIMEWGYYPN